MQKHSPIRGSRNPAKRLSEAQVAAIRQRYEAGDTQGALARLYGVSVNTVGRIVRGETWNWLSTAAADGSSRELAEAELPPLTPQQQAAAAASAAEVLRRLGQDSIQPQSTQGSQQNGTASTPAEQPAERPPYPTDGARYAWDDILQRWIKLPY